MKRQCRPMVESSHAGGVLRALRNLTFGVALGPVQVLGMAQQTLPSPNINQVAEISASLRAGEFSIALDRSTVALQHAPRDPRLWTLKAVSCQGLHHTAEALASFNKALAIAPDYLPALQGAAQLSYATHQPRTEELLNRIVALQPADQVAHAMLGELAFGRSDCATATANFSQAIDAIAQRPEVLLQYSSCLTQMSRFNDAAGVFTQLLVLRPHDGFVRYDLALAQFRAGRGAEASATLAPGLAMPEPAEDDLTLGAEIAESQGNTQQALDLLHKAILLHPRDQGAYLDFVNLAYQHGSLQVGMDVVNVGLQQIPNAAELYFARGVLLCQLGKVDEGFADFTQANQLDPSLSFIGIAQGIAQSQAHHSAAALAQFRAEVKQHPDNAMAWYLLAEALFEQGYAKGTPGFDETVKAARRAAALDPKRVDPEDQLASIELQADDPKAAIVASRAALAIDPEDPQALYHLVLAVRKTDAKAELPELVKRLMNARRNAEAKAESARPHILVERDRAAAPETR